MNIFNNKFEFLIVGLGNPGIKYDNTRHNAGFNALDYLAKNFNLSINKVKFNSTMDSHMIFNKKCVLIKPMSYMNNSGENVIKFMNFYKIPIENTIVLYDDIFLEPSKIKIRRRGGHGGHNGIRSIIDFVESDEFPRIKIGVGNKQNENLDLADWILSKFNKKDFELMNQSYINCLKSLEYIVNGEIEKAMNEFNN